jgi:hypothetical protein
VVFSIIRLSIAQAEYLELPGLECFLNKTNRLNCK